MDVNKEEPKTVEEVNSVDTETKGFRRLLYCYKTLVPCDHNNSKLILFIAKQASLSDHCVLSAFCGSCKSQATYYFQIKTKKIKLDPDASIVDVWARVASKRKQEPPLPTPFEMPRNYPTKIQAGLDEKSLTGRARAKFITTIAESVYRFKSYPTREEYEHVAQQIVKTFSFLASSTGHVSSF